jgi:aryl-alcohol dehydrogenase-like predicted oxidoreductase
LNAVGASGGDHSPGTVGQLELAQRADETDLGGDEEDADHGKEMAMQPVRVGRSELSVSPIAFGTWQLGGDWGTTDEDAAVLAIRRARELGVNFFDTAQAYGFGASEAMLGRALRDDFRHRREEVVVATKGGLRLTDEGLRRDSSPTWLRKGVEESLRALGVEYIDLYQIHWPDPEIPLAETAGALESLSIEGKIHHSGVSNFGPDQMAELSRTWPVETVQPPYDLFRRDIEAYVLPYAMAHDIGVLVYGPLAHGLLSGRMTADTTFATDDWRSGSPIFKGELFRRNLAVVEQLERWAAEELGCSISQLAVAWALAHPAVQVAIVGSRRSDHIEEAVEAADLQLDADALAHVEDIMSAAVPVSGPRPEAM